MQYNFEWDPAKAKENLNKHRVSFERAAEIFLDPFALSIFDDEHSAEEDRWITMGKDRNEVVLVVVHTFHELDVEHCHRNCAQGTADLQSAEECACSFLDKE